MKTIRRLANVAVLLATLLVITGAENLPAAQPRPQVIITDIQVSQIDPINYLLRVQSNGPLAFDRLKSKNTRQVVVQFHQAQLGSIAAFQPPSFGAITLNNDTGGNVILTINLASSSYGVVVSQGGNPNVVELRIRG